MLKWLQTGAYHTTNVNDIITDNPLATLNFKDDEPANQTEKYGVAGSILGFRPQNQKEIYSVNRTNPLYEEGISMVIISEPESEGMMIQSVEIKSLA